MATTTPKAWRALFEGLPEVIRLQLVGMEADDPAIMAVLAATPEEVVGLVKMMSPASDEEEVAGWAILLAAVVDAAAGPAEREQLRVALLSEEAMSTELHRLRTCVKVPSSSFAS